MWRPISIATVTTLHLLRDVADACLLIRTRHHITLSQLLFKHFLELRHANSVTEMVKNLIFKIGLL